MDIKEFLDKVCREPITYGNWSFRWARKGATVFFGGKERVLVGEEEPGTAIIEFPPGWSGDDIPELGLDANKAYAWVSRRELLPGSLSHPCPMEAEPWTS